VKFKIGDKVKVDIQKVFENEPALRKNTKTWIKKLVEGKPYIAVIYNVREDDIYPYLINFKFNYPFENDEACFSAEELSKVDIQLEMEF
jgi:hypothetical protein